MGPDGRWCSSRNPRCVEVVLANEGIVDDDGPGAPAGTPAPTAPATPTAAEKTSDRYADVEEDARTTRRIIPTRIGIVESRPPDPRRIVERYINHFRIGRHDYHDRLARFRSRDHLLLWC